MNYVWSHDFSYNFIRLFVIRYWILVKVPRAQTHRAAQHFWIVDRGSSFDGGGGCKILIWKARPWTIVDNVFGESHDLL